MNTCCFVICYFGKLPSNLDLVLHTCAANPEYNWLLFTDDHTGYAYPTNFQVEYMTFSAMCDYIQNKFDFNIQLNNPRKLCDYKPAYGYLFSDYLVDYPFWGYCDLDQFFGALHDFIPLSFLDQYDKVFSLGHMTIFRNCNKMNNLFMTEYINTNAVITNYKQVYQQSKGLCFDEWPINQVNINVLAEQEKIKIYCGYPMIDVLPRRSYFIGSAFDVVTHQWLVQNNKYFVVYWKQGKIAIINQFKRDILWQEVCYVHIQKRNLKYVSGNETQLNQFLITPNKIIPMCGDDESTIIKFMIFEQKMYSLFHIDEIRFKIQANYSLWKHRFNKYILKIE